MPARPVGLGKGLSFEPQAGKTFTFVTRGDMQRFELMLRESADCWERMSR